MSEYDTAKEHALCFQIGKLKRRIADLSQALGLITTLKPTMVMDAGHPLEMAKEVVEYVTARLAELEAKNNRLVELAEGLADMVDWSGCDCDKPFILTEWEEFIAEVQE